VKQGLLRVGVLLCAVLASVAAQAQTQGGGNYPGSWGHGHMWDGWGWGPMIFGPVFMVLLLGGIVVAIVLALRWLGGGPAGGAAAPQAGKTPLDILKERFARGEIDKEEFEARKRVLSE